MICSVKCAIQVCSQKAALNGIRRQDANAEVGMAVLHASKGLALGNFARNLGLPCFCGPRKEVLDGKVPYVHSISVLIYETVMGVPVPQQLVQALQ